MRRFTSLLAVGAAMLAGAMSVKADFVVTADKIAGAGPLAGYDIWRLYVTNNGANGTGNDVQGWDLTATNNSTVPAGKQPFWFWNDGSDASPTGAMIFNQAGLTGAKAIIDSNGTGASAAQNPDNGGNGSFLALIENDSASEASSGTNTRYTPDRTYMQVGTINPSDTSVGTYAAAKSFRVAAAYSFAAANKPNDRLTGTLRFANIIVPTGNTFTVAGSFLPNAGGDTSKSQYQVNFTNTVPEPGSIGLLGGLAVMALGRRRRVA